MALNRTKVLETAQKHLAKGHYDKAIAEYQKLVDEDPNDVRTWLKIGDLYTRKGARREACDTYGHVARAYAEQGFFLKAVAVYKQILKLDPNRLDISLALAEMYEHLQLVSDALGTYEMVAAAYARQGDVDQALATLGKMAELDPENIPVRIKHAEALSKAGRTEEAADAFGAGASLLKEQGRIDDYIKVAERLLYHRPSDKAVAKDLAVLYLERNDAKRALSKLQICFKADPRNVETLELLARAFHVLGQLPKTISVYREVARLHQEADRLEERAQILRKILELDSNDAEARQALAGYAPKPERASVVSAPRSVPPSAVVESQAAIEAPAPEPELEVIDADEAELIEEGDLVEMEPEAPAAAPAEPAAATPRPVPDEAQEEEILIVEEPAVEVEVEEEPTDRPRPTSIPPDVAREAQIARLLTECDVFLRYGLKNKVVEHLQRILEIDPTHVEGRERLKDAYMEQGRTADAIEQLYALAELFEDDKPQLSQLYLNQILEIDPEHEPARSLVGEPEEGVTAKEPAAPDVEEEVLFVDEESTVDEDLKPARLSEPELTIEEPVATVPEAALEASTQQERPFVPTVEDRIDPAAKAEHRAATEGSIPDVAPEKLEAALAPMSPEEFEAAPLRPSSPGDVEAARKRASMPPGEIEEVLDEAEFFLAQGLLSEARSTLEESLGAHPDHPLILDKITEIGEMEAAQAASAPPAATPSAEDESFLLAEKLAEELGTEHETEAGSDVLDVETVFAQFKKGVEEQIGLEDSDTHFDLGIAYKEMGLLDDAIHEFELAKSNPQRECIAYTMIGLCFVEKGEIADAIAHFKKGLYADSKTEREELGLYFELGAAYELLHDPKEALYYYQKVHKRDASFRNVGAKIKALTSPQAAPQQEAPSVDVDDVDRAFDDLMGED